MYSLFLICIAAASFAQVPVKYEVSDKIKDTKFTSLTHSALTHDGERVMIIKSLEKRFGKTKQRLQMFDQDMNIISDREVKDIEYHSIVSLKDKSYFLCSNDDGNLFLKEIDENSMKEIGKKHSLMQMEKEKGIGIGKSYYKIPLAMVSKDSTKFALSVEKKVKKKDNQEFYVKVFDHNIKTLWDKTYSINARDKDYKLSDRIVGNDGAIYTSGQIITSKKILGKEFNNVQLHRVKNDAKSKYSVNLDEEKRYVGEVVLMPKVDNSEGVDLLSFMYTNRVGLSHILVAQLDENLDITGKKMNEISFKDFITDENDKKKDKTKDKKGKASDQKMLKIRHISELEDNNRLVVAEQYSVATHTHYSGSMGGTTTTTTYYYGDVVVFLLNKNGDLQWAKKIAKRQLSAGDTQLGIGVYSGKNNLYILFNDNEKNLDANKEKLFSYNAQIKKGVFKVVQVNLKTGVSKEGSVFHLKEEDLYANPKSYFQMKDGSLILMGFKRKNRSIIKVSFPKN